MTAIKCYITYSHTDMYTFHAKCPFARKPAQSGPFMPQTVLAECFLQGLVPFSIWAKEKLYWVRKHSDRIDIFSHAETRGNSLHVE